MFLSWGPDTSQLGIGRGGGGCGYTVRERCRFEGSALISSRGVDISLVQPMGFDGKTDES